MTRCTIVFSTGNISNALPLDFIPNRTEISAYCQTWMTSRLSSLSLPADGIHRCAWLALDHNHNPMFKGHWVCLALGDNNPEIDPNLVLSGSPGE